ncbi:MAG: hypothetical protein M1269_00375 [Chloroflexi bacterium]|nr:hypothetical protein [Chloroflexota bacterium]
MTPQSAVFIRSKEQLASLSGGFDRVYFGEEFCEDLMPSFRQARSVYYAAQEKNLGFTLLTPLCSDKGIKKSLDILLRLSDEGIKGEVVLSDWGLLDEVTLTHRKKISFEPVLGRALTRQKSGPRLILLSEVQPAAVETGKRVPLGAGAFMDFLKERGVSRLEVDNPLHGLDIRLPDGFHGSVYYPWVYVSLSRICPVFETVSQGKKRCKRDCIQLPVRLTHPDMPVPLAAFGRTVFYENPGPVPSLDMPGLDRVVYFNPLGGHDAGT